MSALKSEKHPTVYRILPPLAAIEIIMLSTKQYLLEAIETASDDLLEDLRGFLQRRLPSQPNPQRHTALAELQTICQEEHYAFKTVDRVDRANPFLEEA
jgi:hypothetical protein